MGLTLIGADSREPLRLEVPLATPSLNEFAYAHWSGYARLRSKWRRHVWWAMLAANRPGKPRWRRVRIVVTRKSAGRILDSDNLHGGMKPVLDALVYCGVMQDDSDEVIESVCIAQEKAPLGRGATEIVVTPSD